MAVDIFEAEQSAGARGPVDIFEAEKPKRKIPTGEAFGRGMGSTFAEQGNVLGLAAAAPAVAADWIGNLFRDKPSTAAQDFMFRNVVDPLKSAVDYYAPKANEEMGTGATVANVGGRLTGMIPSMVAGGGGTQTVMLPRLADSLFRGAVAAQPTFAVPATVTRAQQLLEAGVEPGTVAEASASNYLANTAMGALPLSRAGGVLTRAGTGAGLNLGAGAAQRGAEAAILGEENERVAQPAFGAQESMTDAGIGAVMAALLGRRAPVGPAPRPPSPLDRAQTDLRADLDASAGEYAARQDAPPVQPQRADVPTGALGADPQAALKAVNEALFAMPPDAPAAPALKIGEPVAPVRPGVEGAVEAPAAPEAVAAAPKVGPAPKVTSLLGAIIKAGGLNPREIRDLTGEGRTGRAGIPVGLFRNPGVDSAGGTKMRGYGLDEMVVKLREDGFNIPDDKVDGGVGALRDMIRAEVMGERTYGRGAEEMAAYTEGRRGAEDAQRYAEDPQYRAEQDGIAAETRARDEQAAAPQAESEAEVRAEREAIKWEAEQVVARPDDVDAVNQRLEEVARESRSDEDSAYPNPENQGEGAQRGIQDGVQAGGDDAARAPEVARGLEEARGTDTAPERGDVSPERPGDGRPDFALDRPTETGLKRAADSRARDEAERARVEAAPAPEGFTLTGSKRPADEAAARGQQELPGTGGTRLYSGPPLDKMAEAVSSAFGWAGREAREWGKSIGTFAQALSDRDIPGAVKGFTRAVFDTSTGALRGALKGSDSKTANWVLDQFSEKGGALDKARGEIFGEAVRSYTLKNMNTVMHALGKVGEADWKQVVAQVRNPDGIRKGTAVGDAALAIRNSLDDALKYLRDAGVEVGEVRDGYYPREFVLDRVLKSPDEFIRGAEQAYRENGLSAKDAAASAKDLHDSLVFGESGSIFKAGKGSPQAPFLKGRVFGKSVDQPAHPLNKFLMDDPVASLSRYFERAARRAELARRFGDKWSKWEGIERQIIDEGAGKELEKIKDYVVLAAGLRAPTVGRGAQAASSWVRTWATLMFLEKATLSSLSEFIVPAIRTGRPQEIGRSLKTTIETLFKSGRTKEIVALGEDLGIISYGMADQMHSQRFAGGEAVSEAQKKILDAFFKRTGLSHWTEATRVGSIDVGRTFIRRLAIEAADGGKLSAKYLGELGIPADKVAGFSKWLTATADGLPAVGDLKGAESDLYRVAMRRFVRQSIMTPDQTTKPAWMSHPLGSIVGQLQSFNYGFLENVWKRNARLLGEAAKNDGEFSTSERFRMAAPMLMMPLLAGAAFVIGEARDALLGDPNHRKTEEGWQKALKAASRGAPVAPIDPLLNWASSARYRRGSAESFSGPFLGKAARGFDNMRDYVANNSATTNTQERRLAQDVWDLVVEPTGNLLLAAAPATPLGKAVAVLGTQALGAGQVREKAFVEPLAGKKKEKTGEGRYSTESRFK